LAGCGKTLRNCHSESFAVILSAAKDLALPAQDKLREESGPAHFQEDTQSEILRCARDDNRGAFFRSLLSRANFVLRPDELLVLPRREPLHIPPPPRLGDSTAAR
jgi:hypothetical protein